MPIELARTTLHQKPWGMRDIRPWRPQIPTQLRTGEIIYECDTGATPEPSLCLKLLFADQPLSIQVHPDDTYAMTIGLTAGKNEAWYVIRAAPGAQIGVGLTQHLSRSQFRQAIADGSIADLLLWRTVGPGDSCLIPAGTVHAIGAGLVIAEIQNRVDSTFRLYDYGRGRELHIDQCMAVALAEPARGCFEQSRLSDTRRLLAVSAKFIFERIDLPPRSTWLLDATAETWLLVLSGHGMAGHLTLAKGDAIFAKHDKIALRVFENGLSALIGYEGCCPNSTLIQNTNGDGDEQHDRVPDVRVLSGSTSGMTAFTAFPGRTLP